MIALRRVYITHSLTAATVEGRSNLHKAQSCADDQISPASDLYLYVIQMSFPLHWKMLRKYCMGISDGHCRFVGSTWLLMKDIAWRTITASWHRCWTRTTQRRIVYCWLAHHCRSVHWLISTNNSGFSRLILTHQHNSCTVCADFVEIHQWILTLHFAMFAFQTSESF